MIDSLFGPLHDVAEDAGYADPPERAGSSPTPRSASAARRARWRARSGTPSPTTASAFTGMSYDNTGGLGASTWRHVAFVEQDRAAPRRGRRRAPTEPAPLADGLGRLQALHARRLPRRLPDRRDVPHRVRHGRRAAGHLQRLRLLRPGLPVRRDRPARGRRPGLEVHALLRPPRRGLEPACAKACPTDSIQFGPLDELRDRADERLATLHERGRRRRPGSTARTRRRRRRRRRVLPAAGRARGVRPAAGPGRHHARPAAMWQWAAAAAAGPGRRLARVVPGRGADAPARARRASAMVPSAEFGSYYGRPCSSAPPGRPAHARLPLPRRARGRGVGAGGDGRAHRAPAARAHRAGSPRRRRVAVGAALLIARPRQAGAVPQHAARVQAHLADEHRLLDPGRARRPATGAAAASALTGLAPPARPRRAGRAPPLTRPGGGHVHRAC